jgi:hypothetical protein
METNVYIYFFDMSAQDGGGRFELVIFALLVISRDLS